ncbi:zinc ribbon-containing protein [Halopelagius longus]|nr:zinc ribbon-containing protein [Halopelagius longus]
MNIVCDSCGVTLLGLRSYGPKPIGRDTCPKCGGTEFSYDDR